MKEGLAKTRGAENEGAGVGAVAMVVLRVILGEIHGLGVIYHGIYYILIYKQAA